MLCYNEKNILTFGGEYIVMVSEDDWRLLNDVEYLKSKYMNPTDGEEIIKHVPYLKKCIFCWDKVQDSPHQWWFIPEDMSCCVCEECYHDFKEAFKWKKLDGWDIDWTLRCQSAEQN